MLLKVMDCVAFILSPERDDDELGAFFDPPLGNLFFARIGEFFQKTPAPELLYLFIWSVTLLTHY